MAIAFNCPDCSARLKVSDVYAGRQVECPTCRRQVTVPAVEEPAPARRRMYVFERAYKDYWSRLVRFARWTVSHCGGIWDWCWRGLGSRLMEWLVYAAAVAGGLALGASYVRYEVDHGRGISVGTVLACLLIVVYGWVLFWGWKTPVHVTARAVSAAAAAAAVTGALLLAFSAAFALFTSYLLLLATLTACSFLIFLPMRFSQVLWLLYRRVAYHCPYDDCDYRGLPVHVCSCGAPYADLLPSFYGLFRHTCRHAAGDVKLPTLDLFGRNKLPRLCGGCKRPLIHSSVGELPVWPVAVVGGPSAGKTVFLRQATRLLCDRLGRDGRGTVRVDSEAQGHDLEADVSLLERGQVLAKTAGDVMQALGVAVRLRRPPTRCLLYLYDAPGEVFTRMERFGRKQNLSFLTGIVLLVDPFALPGLAPQAALLGPGLKPSQVPLDTLVGNLRHRVDYVLTRGPDEPCGVPLAVVLGKCDALPAQDYPFLEGLCPADGDVAVPDAAGRCREALLRLGGANAVRALEMKFANVRYFACSALGRMPDPRDARPFRAAGVAEPLLWLMEVARERHAHGGR